MNYGMLYTRGRVITTNSYLIKMSKDSWLSTLAELLDDNFVIIELSPKTKSSMFVSIQPRGLKHILVPS